MSTFSHANKSMLTDTCGPRGAGWATLADADLSCALPCKLPLSLCPFDGLGA